MNKKEKIIHQVKDEYFKNMLLDGYSSHHLSLPYDNGFLNAEKIIINKDITLFKHEVYTSNNIVLLNPKREFNSFCLIFNIDANAKVNYSTSKQDLVYQNSQTIIGRFADTNANMTLGRNANLKNISIVLSDNFLTKYAIGDKKTDETKVLCQITSNPKINNLAKEIFCINMQNALDKIYLEGKVLEIIAIALFQIKKDKATYKTQFSSYDIDALHRAREILENSYINPPSITELSKIIHLNEFKLKQGYKHIFEQTPYQTVLSQRLLHGKKLLENSDLNITQIAKKVGYKNIQNFTLAFVKHFGTKPKHFKKENSL